MPIPRFHCPPPLPTGEVFELPSATAHHAIRVLRLRVGHTVQLFDGAGHEMRGTIRTIAGNSVVLEKLQACAATRQSPLRITLVQALCSSEKMDWIVQKATELGVADIVPIQAQRSVARLSGERAEKRLAHWQGVIIAACEQCHRSLLPEIHMPREFTAWLPAIRETPGSKLILSPEGALPLHKLPEPAGAVTVMIGPEGGFTDDEVRLAQEVGFTPACLGPRILRTETAAMAGISALQTLWGDFK